ncbi:hypothetical protein [Halocynthiibacter sp.]|uniref:hypothetical protein n=1 Tax=Halocynthiibacter sp. TaxID=1979210 RepID=UPI003C5F371E
MVVTILRQNESPGLDPDRMTELYVQLGEAGAEDVICRAMEELATKLADIHEVQVIADQHVLQHSARSVAELAGKIGLTGLSRVALDVDYCLNFNDPAARAATMARMIRIGEKSLTAVWDYRDLSV